MQTSEPSLESVKKNMSQIFETRQKFQQELVNCSAALVKAYKEYEVLIENKKNVNKEFNKMEQTLRENTVKDILTLFYHKFESIKGKIMEDKENNRTIKCLVRISDPSDSDTVTKDVWRKLTCAIDVLPDGQWLLSHSEGINKTGSTFGVTSNYRNQIWVPFVDNSEELTHNLLRAWAPANSLLVFV
jgi:hypothetical protein